jgi:cytochrome c biogenesis protein CcmG, thiol:disulfide interchange protein DsbE
MRKRFLVIALVVMVIAVGIWAAATPQPGPQPQRTAENPAAETGVTVGKTAPRFMLKDLAENPVAVGPVGKVTVLNFWATWCPPCREEMPQLQKFVQALPPNVVFYAVNIQESAAKAGGFLEQNHYSIPVLLDGDGVVASTFKINAIPTTVIIDKTGKIRFRKAGGVTQTELEDALKGL